MFSQAFYTPVPDCPDIPNHSFQEPDYAVGIRKPFRISSFPLDRTERHNPYNVLPASVVLLMIIVHEIPQNSEFCHRQEFLVHFFFHILKNHLLSPYSSLLCLLPANTSIKCLYSCVFFTKSLFFKTCGCHHQFLVIRWNNLLEFRQIFFKVRKYL